MKKSFYLLFLLLSKPIYASDVELLHAAVWAQPKSSETFIAIPAIKNSMQKIQQHPGSRLHIRYPGGDEGTLWGSELRSWFVALGLSSSRIDIMPGSRNRTAIELEVIVKKN